MNLHYCAGRKARIAEKGYDSNPHSRVTQAFHWWCAGWNDEDIRKANTRYFVNTLMRRLRTDDSNTYKPAGYWREVSRAEWEEFRKQTKGRRK